MVLCEESLSHNAGPGFSPMRLSAVRVIDLVVCIVIPAVIGSVMAGLVMLDSIGPVVRILGWNFYTMWAVGSALALYRRANLIDVFRFRTTHKCLVGWTGSKYAVSKSETEAVVDRTLATLEKEFADARKAVAGCVILFREPSWISLSTFRRVSGEQDGLLLTVGWHEDLEKTDLAHEIAHRVLQVCAEDPSEIDAHYIMSRFDL
jgi:hypothetical protein